MAKKDVMGTAVKVLAIGGGLWLAWQVWQGREAEAVADSAAVAGMTTAEYLAWEKQVRGSWQAIPGKTEAIAIGIKAPVTAQTLASAGIAPSSGVIGQQLYAVQKAVNALPGGKDNPIFRELVMQGLSAQDALTMMKVATPGMTSPAEVVSRYGFVGGNVTAKETVVALQQQVGVAQVFSPVATEPVYDYVPFVETPSGDIDWTPSETLGETQAEANVRVEEFLADWYGNVGYELGADE